MNYNNWYNDDEGLEYEDSFRSKDEINFSLREIWKDEDFSFDVPLTEEESAKRAMFLKKLENLFYQVEGKDEQSIQEEDPIEIAKHQILELFQSCFLYLGVNQQDVLSKSTQQKIIYSHDLPHISPEDYPKVIDLLHNGTARIDLEREDLDFSAVATLIDALLPDSLKLNLSKHCQRLPEYDFFKENIATFEPNIDFKSEGIRYYKLFDRLVKEKHKNSGDILSALMVSAYFQNIHSRTILNIMLRDIRIEQLLDTYDTPTTLSNKSQILQGHSYLTGIGRKQEEKSASRCYRQLAENDNAKGQFYLGLCYLHGIGVKQSDKQAYLWIKKAAMQGHTVAQCELAFCYLYGRGIKKNPKKMYETFQPLAEKGYKFPAFIVGLCLSYGVGVEQNIEDGVKYSESSSEYDLMSIGNTLRTELFHLLEE